MDKVAVSFRQNSGIYTRNIGSVQTQSLTSTTDYNMNNQRKHAGPSISGLIRITSLQTVATGGMSDVYHGEWTENAKRGYEKLAVKFFRAEHIDAEKADAERVRLLRETRAWEALNATSQLPAVSQSIRVESNKWAGIHHPNILPFYGVCYGLDRFPQSHGMVSPWMDNGDIRAFLSNNPNTHRGQLIYQVACGLEYLHTKGIIHGDLRGCNILINDKGQALISDFGRAKLAVDDEYTKQLLASAAWTAPEVLLYAGGGDVPVSESSDVWSLGMTTLEVFVGQNNLWANCLPAQIVVRLARGIQPTRQEYPDVPQGYWQALNGCFKSDPCERPSSSGLRARLQQLLNREAASHRRS
ncbi:kinase-like protein [Rickenella mellea]|uniref:Kinase-like protein n=1 Tax=Rickenella mellea TaxID=50990 RepID=A0A4Y7Q852_9AGAM|nr:kinase-like protein [Rickenella mellea]